jgi:hypothetical protein
MAISSVYNYLFLMVRWNDLNKHFGWYDAYLMVIILWSFHVFKNMEFTFTILLANHTFK